MIIETNIDTMVEALEPQLRMWLSMIKGEDDGTLFFPIRNCGALPDVGTLIIAGCAYVPNSGYGAPLNGADPVQLVMDVCRTTDPFMQAHVGCTPLELMLDLEDAHPIVANALFGAARRRIEAQRADEKREAVEVRSRTLLHEFLDDEQMAEMTARTQFYVQGADGHTYLIRKGHGHNVFRIEGGERTVEYCLVCKGWVPDYDLMLTQMLLLQADPAMFIETANTRELGPKEPAVMDVLPLHDAFVRLEMEPVEDPARPGVAAITPFDTSAVILPEQQAPPVAADAPQADEGLATSPTLPLLGLGGIQE